MTEVEHEEDIINQASAPLPFQRSGVGTDA